MNVLNNWNPFRKPTALSILKETLDDYERQLLVREAEAAYHSKMAEYYREGIARLKKQSK